MKIPARSAATLAFLLGVAACSSNGDDTSATPNTNPAVEVDEPASSTTVAGGEAEAESVALPSPGSVIIGELQYDLSFECFLDEEGNALALGVGEHPTTGQRTEAIVQVFSNQPYVGLIVDDAQLLELAIDAPVELFVQAGVISGSALRFVESTGSAGVGEPLGLGTVTVECSSFAPGLPEGFDIS